jgi:hypothetical protein
MVNPPGFARSGERQIISPFLLVFPEFSPLSAEMSARPASG